MKKWFTNLTNTYKTAFISIVIVIVGYLALLFGYFVDMIDLPNGFIAGGLLGSLSYLAMGFVEKIDEKKDKPVWTIIVTIIRYLLIGGLVVLAAFLQFKMNYRILNVFTVLGGYFVALMTYVVILLIERKHV